MNKSIKIDPYGFREYDARWLYEKDINDLGSIKISETGKKYFSNPEDFYIMKDNDFSISHKTKKELIKASVIDAELMKRLVILRKNIAEKKSLPPYAILQEFSLEDMTYKYPTTLEEFKNINGVGEGKVVKFGNQFIELIRDYIKEFDIVKSEDIVLRTSGSKSSKKLSLIQNIDKKIPFDDFFFGKASTYPDANGSIGILFEQGSSRGHIQESTNGILTFPFTIRNQLTAAFSTLKAAKNMRVKLLDYMKDFYDKQIDSASKYESIIFGKEKDKSTVYHLAEVLNSHKIKFNTISQDVEVNGTKYSKDNSFIVPLNQPKRTLIRAMFDTQTTFSDSLFYDVSAWTFPLAFNVNYDNTNRLDKPGKLGIKSEEVENLKRANGSVDKKSDYAYLFEPHEYYAQSAVYQLIKSGLRVKTATRTFAINGEKFDFGTYMISVQNQSLNSDEIYNLLVEISSETGINVKSQSTGITDGIDLGSNNFEIVKEPKIGLVVGEGVRSYDAGEIWHLLDTRFNIPITKLDVGDLGYIDLSRYTHIILPDYSEGSQYQSTGGNINKNQINDYIKDGGNLIAYRNSVKWVSSNLSEIDFHTNDINADDVTFSERLDG